MRETADVLFQRLDWLRNSTVEVKNTVQQIFVINFQMYGEILRVQSLVTNQIVRSPQMNLEAPWILEDCLGRVSPVHRQFIVSWEVCSGLIAWLTLIYAEIIF